MSSLLKSSKYASVPIAQAIYPHPLRLFFLFRLRWKLQITSYISNKEDPEPTLIILRRTHGTFRNLVPPAPYGPGVMGNSALVHSRKKRLQQAEREQKYLIPPKMLPCYRCLRVLGRLAFDKFETYMPDWRISVYDTGSCAEERVKSLGCTNAHTRRYSRCCNA